MKQPAIIIYGPPGSGKGTQANLLAHRLGLIHFDTGTYLENVVNDPANKNNQKIQKEKKNFEAGVLIDPKWVLGIVKTRAKQIHQAGFGVVFSGSPRTLLEVSGVGKIEGLISFLEKIYGRKNIYMFSLQISAADSLKRNRTRLISPLTGLPLMGQNIKLKTCPFTGGPLKKRSLDKPEIIEHRLVEYANRTKPVLKALTSLGYKINEIDGRPLPYKVHESIMRRLK